MDCNYCRQRESKAMMWITYFTLCHISQCIVMPHSYYYTVAQQKQIYVTELHIGEGGHFWSLWTLQEKNITFQEYLAQYPHNYYYHTIIAATTTTDAILLLLLLLQQQCLSKSGRKNEKDKTKICTSVRRTEYRKVMCGEMETFREETDVAYCKIAFPHMFEKLIFTRWRNSPPYMERTGSLPFHKGPP